MKKLLFLFLLLPLLGSAQSGQCVIKGKLLSPASDSLHLVSLSQEYELSVRIPVKNNEFTYTLPVGKPFLLSIGDDKSGGRFFFAEAGTVTFEADDKIGKAKVYATASNSPNNELEELTARVDKAIGGDLFAIQDSLGAARKKEDAAKIKKYEQQLRAAETTMKSEITAFIKQHPNSVASAFLLPNLADGDNFDEAMKLFTSLSYEVQTSELGQNFLSMAGAKNTVATGEIAPSFTFKHNGKLTSLENLRGKVVLVEFWASWCAPCLREMPGLVKSYQDYKDRGFEVVAVSLDAEQEKWEKAIEKHQLPFIHHADLRGWNSLVAQKYAISAIPVNFLIDQNGYIVAKNLKGKELTNKLAELLK